IYRDMAATIYGLDRDTFLAIPKDALTLEQQQQRLAGKTTILGCGYQMGPDSFRRRYCRHLLAEEAKSFAENLSTPIIGRIGRRRCQNSGATSNRPPAGRCCARGSPPNPSAGSRIGSRQKPVCRASSARCSTARRFITKTPGS